MDQPVGNILNADDIRSLVFGNRGNSEIEILFVNLVMPEFSWINGAVLELQNMDNVPGGVEVGIFISDLVRTFVGDGNAYEAGPFVIDYINHMQKIQQNVTAKFTPVVSSESLIDAGLSPEQFIIQLVSISMEPYILTEVQDGLTSTLNGVLLYLTIRMEDVSIFEPGEIGELATRFRYLCKGDSQVNMDELRAWVESTGVPKETVAQMNKAQLCLVLKNKYKF